MSELARNIFNTEKSDYTKTPLFLGQPGALFDTVNKQYPRIWALYMKMKSLDWDPNEFDYSPCNNEFKSCPKSVYDMMIKTLAWQWEADSVACRQIAPIVAPFISSSELWAAWQRCADNEVVHAATYSEIVRNSFDHPDDILAEILKVKESFARLHTVASVMNKAFEVSHNYALGNVSKDVAYEAIFMFTVTMLVLERIQFMSSFAVTFAIAETGMFLPIGKAVQKICQDEFEVHVELDKAILNIEMTTERGRQTYERLRPQIQQLVEEVYLSERAWVEYAFSEGRELVGLNSELLLEWVQYNVTDVLDFLKLDYPFKAVRKNPLGFIEEWISIGRIQTSPQEEKVGQYMLGMVTDNAGDKTYSVDF